MLIKITLALALALAALATVASYNNNATPIASLASGGGNLVPVWWPLLADAARMRNRTDFVRNAVERELQRREKMKTEKKARD
jgi:hypothetical protein